ncbi:hypothetical protein JXA40_05380 [bacterium]|nr:hypothetical protein [candidate division CSSED10-310 bacterium]
MRKFLLFALATLMVTSAGFAQTCTVGSTTGITDNRLPFYQFYTYSEGQYCIPASEMALCFPTGGTFSEIGWHWRSGAAVSSSYTSIDIYLKNIPDPCPNLCTAPDPNPGTLVYSGPWSCTAAIGWKMIAMSTPFTYNPGDCLLVTVCDTLGPDYNYGSSVYWSTNSLTGSGFMRYSDSVDPVDCDLTTALSYSSCINEWVSTGFTDASVPTPTPTTPPPGCDHQICLIDSFGDGWNGGTVAVTVNGNPVPGSPFTLASGTGPTCYTFTADTGDAIFCDYTPGSWSYENEYYVLDGSGLELGRTGSGGTVPADLTLTGNCPSGIVISPDPSVVNSSGCGNQTLTHTLQVGNFTGQNDTFNLSITGNTWTTTVTSTNPVAINDNQFATVTVDVVVPVLTAPGSDTCTFNVAAVTGTDTATSTLTTNYLHMGSVTTLFAQNNGQSGNMFDIDVAYPTTITAFDINVDAIAVNIEIYTKSGTCVGFETNASAWTLLYTVTGVAGAGPDNPTFIDLSSIGGWLVTGGTYGVYITCTNGTYMNYTTGGPWTYSSGPLTVTTHSGNAYPFSSFFAPRAWNGTVYYSCDTVQGVYLTPAISFGMDVPGSTVIHNFLVQNFSGVSELFDLSIGGSPAWTTTINGLAPPITIGPIPDGGNQTFTVEVVIPGTATYPDTDTCTVTATGQTSAYSDTSDITTQAFPSLFYAYGLDVYPGTGDLKGFFDLGVPGNWFDIGAGGIDFHPAGDFLGNDFSQIYMVGYYDNVLKSVNTVSGVATTIGACAPTNGQWTGFSGAADGSAMYAMSSSCGTSSTLHTVDVTTGAVTAIGTTTTAPCIIDIAVSADGSAIYGVDLVDDNLYSIDPTTGAATSIGSTGAAANYAQGMDFDYATGELYWAAYTAQGELRTLDIGSGMSTLVGAFPSGAEVDCLSVAQEAGAAYIALIPAMSNQSGPAGSTLTHTLSLENHTGAQDTFDLAISGYTWTTVITSTNPVTIDDGAAAAVTVNVTIPAGAATLDSDSCTLTATGQVSGLSDSSTLNTTAMPPTTEAYGIELVNGELEYWPDLHQFDTWTVIGTGVSAYSFFAGDFLGTDHTQLYCITYDTNTLYSVDVATSVATMIGSVGAPTGGASWSGMTSTYDGSVMYAICTNITQSYLYTVDLTTPSVTLVGQITNAAGAIDVAINSLGEMYVHDIVADSIYSVDTATGAGTLVGTTGFSANYAQGMDCDQGCDAFYLSAFNAGNYFTELRLVNTTTGACPLLSAMGYFLEVDSFGILPASIPPTPTPTPSGPTPTPGDIPTTGPVGLGILLLGLGALLGISSFRRK